MKYTMGADRTIIAVADINTGKFAWYCVVADDGNFSLPANVTTENPNGYLILEGNGRASVPFLGGTVSLEAFNLTDVIAY